MSADAQAAGDALQSAAARLIEELPTYYGNYDYETRMAVLEAESAIQAWTDARRKDR